MIPYVDSTEKTIACTLSNNKLLDLGVDLLFVAGGITTTAGIYFYFNPAQKPPELIKYTDFDIAIAGAEGMLISSLYRMLLPSVTSGCR